jgi:hypothetical protein
MKRRIAGIVALAGAVAVAIGIPAVGASAPKEYTGKPCMDIFVTADYRGVLGGTATVTGTLQTQAAPSCAGAVYTVYVIDGGTQTFTFVGDGTTDAFSYSATVADAPASICVYATSRPNSKSSSVADRAPDAGCTASTPNVPLNPPGGGASGFG